MLKAVLMTALIGAATASYAKDYDPVSFDMFNINVYFESDAGLRTLYNSKQSDDFAVTPSWDNMESYAINVFSYLKIRVTTNLLQMYRGQYEFTLNVLDFTPIGSTVSWSRMDKGQPFKGTFTAFRDLQILNFFTVVKENMKVLSWSVIPDAGMDYSPKWGYNLEKPTEYVDPVWKYDLGAKALKLKDTLGNWYGFGTYYTYTKE